MLNHLTTHHRTKILPLRWISNWLSYYASDHLLKSVYLEENNNFGWSFKYHSSMWKILNLPYKKWGTYYTINMAEWKDYLTNGESKDF
jgi:hypothetical protein